MNWRGFRKTGMFKDAGIVICLKKGIEVNPRPFDKVITAYPVIHRDYPHIPTLCVELN